MNSKNRIQAGDLDDRVTLRAPAGSPEANYGQVQDGWAAVAERWAKVEPVGGRDMWYSQQPQNIATHKLTLRATGAPPGLDASWSALWGTRMLSFESVQRLESRGDMLLIFCVEQTTGG